MVLSMQDNQDEHFTSAERRRRTLWIVLAHALVVAVFFTATFFWGNFR
jgi:hypothetical protein